MKELCSRLGIKQNLSTVYYPQTDGQTERVNQEVEQYLHLYVSYQQGDWSEWLPLAKFAHNNQSHLSIGLFLFFINLERHPNTRKEVRGTKEKVLSVDEFLEGMSWMRKGVELTLKRTNKTMKWKFDTYKRDRHEFGIGDLVWVNRTHYNTDRPS